jgi:hypothetical protein
VTFKAGDPRRARPRGRRAQRHAPLPAGSAAAGDPHSIDFLASEFTTRYLREERRRPEQAERLLNHDVLPAWAGRDARTITPREVIELLDSIVARGSPMLANHVYRLLSQMFRFGIGRLIVESSPVQLLQPPGGSETPRDRVLTEDELRVYPTRPEATPYPPREAERGLVGSACQELPRTTCRSEQPPGQAFPSVGASL